jgi:Flp pilus assembly protein CpaB
MGAEQERARRTRRGWTTRLSTGHAVMVLAGLLGVVLTLGVLRDDREGTAVLVAASDLVPGTVLDRASVRVARVDASADLLAELVPADTVAAVDGSVATQPVAAGAPLPRDAVAEAASGSATRSMSFPLPRARALGGALEAGERVDVLGVAQGAAEAAYVMTDAEVLAVAGADRGPLGTSDELTVTLAVDSDAARRVAAALEAGTVTLVRATGAPPMDAR